MNKIIQRIANIFIEKFDKIAIETTYGLKITYGELIKKIDLLLSNLSPYESFEKIKLILIGESRIEWIVVFLATLFSKFDLVIVDPEINKEELCFILQTENPDIIFIDKKSIQKIDKLRSLHKLKLIVALDSKWTTIEGNNIGKGRSPFASNDLRYHIEDLMHKDKEINPIIYSLYSPGTISIPKKIDVTEEMMITNMDINKNLIEQHNNVTSLIPFCYHPILSILSVLESNSPILVKDINNFVIPSTETYILSNYDNKGILIITLPIFLKIWKKYMNNIFESKLWMILISTKLLRIFIKRLFKNKFQKAFGKYNEYLIWYGSLPINIEEILILMEIPINQCYGLLETGGIVSYSSLNKRIPNSAGTLLNPYDYIPTNEKEQAFVFNNNRNKETIFTDDMVMLYHNHIFVKGKIKTMLEIIDNNNEILLVCPEQLENILKQHTSIEDLFIITDTNEKKLIAFARPNLNSWEISNIDLEEFQKLMFLNLKKHGNTLPLFKSLREINTYSLKIDRTYNGSIKGRTIYKNYSY